MAKRALLEISVESAERAVAAERGGADRIELCSELSVGGLTPARALMDEVRAVVRVPVFAMIRPRAGEFAYSSEEFNEMREAIAVAREARMDGVGLGVLRQGRQVDERRTQDLVRAAKDMDVTFHRAIDDSADLLEALEAIAETGATRILTSGGRASALEGAAMIARMVERARGRLTILAGAGITAENVGELMRRTGVREVHAGLSTVMEPGASAARFETEIRKLATALQQELTP